MKKQRKKIVTCSFFVCLAVFLFNPAWAITLSLNPSSLSAGISDLVDIDIVISGMGNDDLAAFDFNIAYDNTVLDFDTYVLGNGLGSIENFNADDWSLGDIGNGIINLSELSWLWDFSFQSDTFTLATMSFIAGGVGESLLSFSDVILTDGWGDTLAAGLEQGSINVSDGTSDPVPEPASLFLLGSGLIGLARFKRKLKK
ncbi:MAG: PEP-CTERM sorting domain-containing protein [Desulfobacteraceae bacterium]|nr:PEP-CTERM sorting domain-containing protein [Desulfobacteraceae bacterium]